MNKVAGKREALPAIAIDQALDCGVCLDNDGHAPQRPVRARHGILMLRRSQCTVHIDRLHRTVNAVVSRDAVDVPARHLLHGVLVPGVKRLEARDIGLQQVAVHARLLSCRQHRQACRQSDGR